MSNQSAQHDAHLRTARTVRTIFYSELAPGKSVELRASYLVPTEKVLWAALRLLEAKRMEMDGTWRADFDRLGNDVAPPVIKAGEA